jgi:hypothetical protein
MATIDRKKKPQFGYLDRDGNFYACYAWGHLALAAELTDNHIYADFELEDKRGWMSLRSGFNWFHSSSKYKYPSKKQWDFIFDWCMNRNKKFPPKMLEDLWQDQETGI